MKMIDDDYGRLENALDDEKDNMLKQAIAMSMAPGRPYENGRYHSWGLLLLRPEGSTC